MWHTKNVGWLWLIINNELDTTFTVLSSPVQEQACDGHLTCKSCSSFWHALSSNTCMKPQTGLPRDADRRRVYGQQLGTLCDSLNSYLVDRKWFSVYGTFCSLSVFPIFDLLSVEYVHGRSEIIWTISLPRLINFKFPLQPHHKNLGIHSLPRWKMIILPILTASLFSPVWKGWKNTLFELGGDRAKPLVSCGSVHYLEIIFIVLLLSSGKDFGQQCRV